jgi:hypothetical protein
MGVFIKLVGVWLLLVAVGHIFLLAARREAPIWLHLTFATSIFAVIFGTFEGQLHILLLGVFGLVFSSIGIFRRPES